MKQLLVILAVVLSGCLQGQDKPAPDPLGAEPSTTGAGTPNPVPTNAPSVNLTTVQPREISWAECRGVSATAYRLAAENDPPVPEGQGYDWPINEFYFHGYECARMNFGRFERGPVRFMFDGHSNYLAREACSEGDFFREDGLGTFWIDDQEIASALAELGMNARLATFAVSGPVDGVTTWSWESQGSTSSLSFSDNEQDSGNLPLTLRQFWFKGSTLGYMDFTMNGGHDLIAPASGLLDGSTLYGNGMTMPFVGVGNNYPDIELSAEIRLFGDLQCLQEY